MPNAPTIVIPYYKLRFLDAALDSLAAQTVKDFRVFIGDDASPEEPSAVINKYRAALQIDYHRFESNLGRTSLPGHWNRCVKMTGSEWVWLFSDDDVASPGCMESFLKSLAETGGKYDVYRFNTRMIDENGRVILNHPAHPQVEKGSDFALAKVLMRRYSFAVEYIFRRTAFEAAGGFVDFPVAWCSDDASWIAFAGDKGIYTMANGEVLWRKSGLNLSSPKPELARAKLEAFQKYLTWLAGRFPDKVFRRALTGELEKKFSNQLQHWGGRPDLKSCLKFWFFFRRYTGTQSLLLLRTFLGLAGLKGKMGRLLGGGAAVRPEFYP